jgi:hypothetical protein
MKWRAFMDKYYPDGDKTNANNLYGYVQAEAMLQVLKQCGDNLTRENVMKQADCGISRGLPLEDRGG